MFRNSISSSQTNTKLLPTLQYKHFFLITGDLIINWLLLSHVTCCTVVLKDYPHYLTKYEGKGTSKIPIFKLSCALGKFGSAA